MRTIKLSGGDLRSESMMVRTDLTQASSPVEVNYMMGKNSAWEHTQYQCADTSGRMSGLIAISKSLAAVACEMAREDFSCDVSEI